MSSGITRPYLTKQTLLPFLIVEGALTQIEPLQLTPIYQPRVWGGNRLRPAANQPIGEAWVIYEHNLVAEGYWQGKSLAEVAGKLGADLLGDDAITRTGDRFPLLIKLLDAQDWLSVQVHPNDEKAQEFEGPDEFGKTEAWYILAADEGARLISGLVGAPSRETVRRAAEDGTLDRYLNSVDVSTGDAIFIPAGRVHAIGPGLLIYEVQQTSDITYRLFDWNRPASAGRELHLEKGIAVISTADNATVDTGGDDARLVHCQYFTLDEIIVESEPVAMTTGGRSFHALTVASGEAVLRTGQGEIRLSALESVLVPAAIEAYELVPVRSSRILLARVA